jgi:hypothetical protein
MPDFSGLDYALTPMLESESQKQKVACQKTRSKDGTDRMLKFRSMGVVFSLTTEGHIEVRYFIFYIVQ